jgi:hypothetical protein
MHARIASDLWVAGREVQWLTPRPPRFAVFRGPSHQRSDVRAPSADIRLTFRQKWQEAVLGFLRKRPLTCCFTW